MHRHWWPGLGYGIRKTVTDRRAGDRERPSSIQVEPIATCHYSCQRVVGLLVVTIWLELCTCSSCHSHTTSVILSSYKIQNGDILVPANPDPPEKMAIITNTDRVFSSCYKTWSLSLSRRCRQRSCEHPRESEGVLDGKSCENETDKIGRMWTKSLARWRQMYPAAELFSVW